MGDNKCLEESRSPYRIPLQKGASLAQHPGGVLPRLMALRTSLAWRLRNFVMNHRRSCRLVASFIDWSKRLSVLRHTLPKRKSLPIAADCVDDTSSCIRAEMTPRHFSLDHLYALSNHPFEITPLCVRGVWNEGHRVERLPI